MNDSQNPSQPADAPEPAGQPNMTEMTRREFISTTTQVSGAIAAGLAAGELAPARAADAPPAAAAPPELVMMNATELSRTIHSKQASCGEVMNAFLDHIGRFNPKVNAIVSLQERSGLLAQAAQRDAQLARGESLGWMHGFPHAVKDLAPTKGIRTTWGSPLLDTVPDFDAIFVERLKKAGAIIIGKTNTPEFGMGSQTYNPIFGITLNAYDQSKTSGGSSGGAASALALRMLPVADGSDMMGSLRNPAAWNNVIGFRTSYGRIPGGPGGELFLTQLSALGPMARSAADAAMLLSVMAGPDAREPLSIEQDPAIFTQTLQRDFKGVRLGWLGEYAAQLPFEPGVVDLCKAAFKSFEAIGCTVEEVKLGISRDALWDTWLKLRHWVQASAYADLYNNPAKRPMMKDEAQWEIEGGLKLSAVEVFNASVARSNYYEALRKLFETYEYLLLPSAQVFPFDAFTHWPQSINGVAMDTYHRWMEVVVPGSLSGCPVIDVPVGFSQSGLPMGMQLIGKNHADFAVLQIAYAYEQATGWVSKNLPPLLK